MVSGRAVSIIFTLCNIWNFLEAAPPALNSLPTVVYVGELETTERLLHIYNVTDPNGDLFTCTNVIVGSPANDNDNEFDLRWNQRTGKYELWLTGLATFNDATTDTYVNTMQCTDGNGEVSLSRTLSIELVNNELVNLYEADFTLNARNTGSGQSVGSILSTSTLGHRIRYSLISDPSYTPEFFVIDSSTGEITTNRELKYIDAGTPTMYLTVSAFDEIDHIIVYNNQTIHLTNQNTIPTISNLPETATVLESLAAGSILTTLTTVDIDTADTHTYRFDCVPVAGESILTLDSNQRLKIATGQSLNYEGATFINCSFYVSDGLHEGGPFLYQLYVDDVNEAPTFSESIYYVTISEGTQNSLTVDPGFTCTDPDAGDVISYSLQNVNNSERFRINADGTMTFNVDYDVDNNNMPTTVYLTVYCVDDGDTAGILLTGSTLVQITITDVNDNTPTFPAPSYSFSVTQNTVPGSVIGTIVPTDADSGTNGDVTCTGVSASTYQSYYAIGYDCNVYLTKAIDFESGTYTGFTAYATDNGSPQRTGTVGVGIVYTLTDTTTASTTTTTAYNFFAHGENVALFVLTLLMGLALLGLLGWFLWRTCCGQGDACGRMGRDCCPTQRRQYNDRRRPRRAVTPERSPTPRRADTPPPKYTYKERPPDPEPQPRLVRSVGRLQPGYWRGPVVPRGYNPSLVGPPSLPGFYR